MTFAELSESFVFGITRFRLHTTCNDDDGMMKRNKGEDDDLLLLLLSRQSVVAWRWIKVSKRAKN